MLRIVFTFKAGYTTEFGVLLILTTDLINILDLFILLWVAGGDEGGSRRRRRRWRRVAGRALLRLTSLARLSLLLLLDGLL